MNIGLCRNGGWRSAKAGNANPLRWSRIVRRSDSAVSARRGEGDAALRRARRGDEADMVGCSVRCTTVHLIFMVEIFDDDARDGAVRSGAVLYLGKMREGMEKFDPGLLYFNKI